VALQALPGVRQVQLTEGRLKLSLDELAAPTQKILQALQAQGVQVTHLSSGRATLEDVFLALTGRQLRD
jgi:ABC-2 type transport system ATP-binding protein